MLISPQVAQHPFKSPCGGGYLGVPVKSAHGGSQGRTRWGRVELPTAGRLCYRERSVCRLHPCLLFLRCLHDSVQKVLAFLQPLCHFEHLCSGLHSLVVGTAAKMARETCNAVPENVHCHLFRKTKAMDLYKNGIPLPFIMQLLGHESMSTTSGFYAFATLEMMSDAINKSVPIIGGTEKLWKNKNAKQALYTLD